MFLSLFEPNSSKAIKICYNAIVTGDRLRDIPPSFLLQPDCIHTNIILHQLQFPSIVAKYYTTINSYRSGLIVNMIELCQGVEHESVIDQLFTSKVLPPRMNHNTCPEKNRHQLRSEVYNVIAAFARGFGLRAKDYITNIINFHCHDILKTVQGKQKCLDTIILHSQTSELFFAIYDQCFNRSIFCSLLGLKSATRHGFRDIIDVYLDINDLTDSNGNDQYFDYVAEYNESVSAVVKWNWIDIIRRLKLHHHNVIMYPDVLCTAVKSGHDDTFEYMLNWLVEALRRHNVVFFSYGIHEYDLIKLSQEVFTHGTVHMVRVYCKHFDCLLSISSDYRANAFSLREPLINNAKHGHLIVDAIRTDPEIIPTRFAHIVRRDAADIMRVCQLYGDNFKLFKALQVLTQQLSEQELHLP